MLTRFSPKIGAAVFAALGVIYMVAALATGHSARAEQPVNLAPTEAGLDVWRALALLADHPGQVAIVDVRPAELFESYHVPGARSLPAASAAAVRKEVAGVPHLLIVAETDTKAGELVGALGASGGSAHFLKGGAPEFYLSLELPAPLFSSKPPPHGYAESMAKVRAWLATPSAVPAAEVRAAIGTLSSLGFAPDQLGGKKKAAPGGAKKKISGGCG